MLMPFLVLRMGASALHLTIVEQTLHVLHRPPAGLRHVEVPARLEAASTALHNSNFSDRIKWRRAVDSAITPDDAVDALKLVHTIEHLRTLQSMSKTGVSCSLYLAHAKPLGCESDTSRLHECCELDRVALTPTRTAHRDLGKR